MFSKNNSSRSLSLFLIPGLILLAACDAEQQDEALVRLDQWADVESAPFQSDTLSLDSLDWSSVNIPKEPDYDEPQHWFIQEAQAGEAQVDVFYTCPTVIITDYLKNWKSYGYMDVFDENQRKEMLPKFEEAAAAFGVTANFYSFYYRQMTLQSFISEASVAKRFPYAFQDVKRAFNYYIEHYNHGRPFIIAGYSQGGKSAVELVKALPPSLKERMVAAYVMGYKITAEDLALYPNLQPAMGRADVGVTCCFSSVGDEASIWPIIQAPVACAINPVSWSTEGDPVEIPWVQGEDVSKPVTVRKDMERNIMFVDNYGINDFGFYPVTWVMGKKNYHPMEFILYTPSLVQNVAARSAAYFAVQTGIRNVWF